MSTIKKYKLKDIKKKIKEKESSQYWFFITQKKSILIAKANKISEAKNIVKEKIKKKPKKYENKILRRFQIKFRNEKINMNTGTILILINNFQVKNGKIKKFYIKGKQGSVWLTKKYLQLQGWNKKNIIKITNYLDKNKVKLSGIGSNMYDVDFRN